VSRAGETGTGPKIDVFAAYHCAGWFALHKWVRGRLPREAILQLGEVVLEGRRLPAPRDPAALLALTYGETWRVPDPSFTFDYTPEMRDRAEPWFGNWRLDKSAWPRVNRKADRAAGDPPAPSAFARQVGSLVERGDTVIDVGCGTGRDALWFAGQGHRTLGVDYLARTCRQAEETARSLEVPAHFENVNLYDLRTVLAFAGRVGLEDEPYVVYARHLLDALRPVGRESFWILARAVLRRGGAVHTQFYLPTTADGRPQRPPPPFRGGVDPGPLRTELEGRGWRVEAEEILAEDAGRVCRWTVRRSC
jgi:SAM-dependent methyltransferase